MAFRQTYSRLDNAPESQAVSSLEIVAVINNLRIGRLQGLRYSGQAGPRPVTEIGTDRTVEFVPGLKSYQGTVQSITIKYGDLVKRLVSMAGGIIDPDSHAAMLSNMPEFDIQILDRGNPNYQSPLLYAPSSDTQNLAGSGKLIKTLMGCVIETFDQSFNSNEALVMESVSLKFVDIVPGTEGSTVNNQELRLSGIPDNAANLA